MVSISLSNQNLRLQTDRYFVEKKVFIIIKTDQSNPDNLATTKQPHFKRISSKEWSNLQQLIMFLML